MKILISVCGEGFGHTTRCISVGQELSKYHNIAYIAYGKSKTFIEKYGYKVYQTCPEVKLIGKDGKFDIKKSIFNKEYSPTKAIMLEKKIVKEYNPDLIISDCKYSTVAIAKVKKIPFYVITNQNYTGTDKKEKIVVTPVMNILNLINKSAKNLIIPDLPRPYTICHYNLKDIGNLLYSGPLIRYNLENYKVKRGNYILSIIGGFEYRYKILEELNKIAEKNNLKVKMVCGSKEVAEKISKNKSKNVEIIPIVKDIELLMKNCSFVVCHGGHSTLMESICFGKPVITVPDLDHPEQENNAKKINELKNGICLSYKNLNKLEEAIDEINNNDIYFKNAEKLSEICRKYDGKKNINKIITENFNNTNNF